MSGSERITRALALATLVLMLAALATLGAAWSRGRTRAWNVPSWAPQGAPQEFIPLRAATAGERAHEIWVVPVNPRCPHCAGHLAGAAAAARAAGNGVHLEVLIVDTPKPPAAETFARTDADGWWWDARDTWRRRWGHRVYGERIEFDGAGRYRRTEPPVMVAAPRASP